MVKQDVNLALSSKQTELDECQDLNEGLNQRITTLLDEKARLEHELERYRNRYLDAEQEVEDLKAELYEARESAEARRTSLCISLERLYSAIRTHKRLAVHFARIEDKQLWSNLPEEKAKEREVERAAKRVVEQANDNS